MDSLLFLQHKTALGLNFKPQIKTLLVFHAASRHYFRPEESGRVTVHIYNCDLGSQQLVTQSEPSWREVTNEKQPKSSSLLYNRQMLDKNFVTEPMKTSELFTRDTRGEFVCLSASWIWFLACWSKSLTKNKNPVIYHADIGCIQYNEQYRNHSNSWPCKTRFTSLWQSVGGHGNWLPNGRNIG